MPPGRGFIPPSVDLSHLVSKVDGVRGIMATPTSWDWRTEGKVTPIRNQGACGSCYAFAALANFESKLLIDGEGSFDFSENNAKECNFFETSCDGGNFHKVADFLSKKATVLEACDPYVSGDVDCDTSCTYQKTLTDWRIISGNVAPSTDDLKQYIYDKGPVYTTLYSGDGSSAAWQAEFNSYDGSYTMYYAGAETINHAVQIIGWDDDLVHADGTGAWIVKNSWGTGWGGTCGYGAESGYFTIAYGSASIGKYSSFVNGWADYSATDSLYFYDEGGWTSNWGYGATTVYGMCEYTLAATNYVLQVEFWTNDITTDVDVYLYDDFDGTTVSNLLASREDTSFTEAGYHTVAFALAPEVAVGNDVYAMVKITNNSYAWPMAADSNSNETGKTWMSETGLTGSWTDLGIAKEDDVGIRIRTSPVLALGVDDESGALPDGFELATNYPNPFNPSTTIAYTLSTRSEVDITIYNLLGQQVRTLVDETQRAGEYEVEWDGRTNSGGTTATGVYIYRINTGEYSQSRKMLLLK
jgi:C1A family cysteine protease